MASNVLLYVPSGRRDYVMQIAKKACESGIETPGFIQCLVPRRNFPPPAFPRADTSWANHSRGIRPAFDVRDLRHKELTLVTPSPPPPHSVTRAGVTALIVARGFDRSTSKESVQPRPVLQSSVLSLYLGQLRSYQAWRSPLLQLPQGGWYVVETSLS